MIKRVLVASTAVAACTIALAVPANAATSAQHGITVRTPHSVTAYNGGRAKVTPKITVASGLHRAVTAHQLTAYKVGTHKHWTSRSSLRLHAGTYKVKVRVQYRDYTSVAGQPTVKHWVGGYHYWTTAKRTLVVHSAHRKIWHGRHTYTTGYKSVPKGAHVYYAFVSPAAGSCSFALSAKYSGHVQQLADERQHSGSGAFVTKRAMRVRFHVHTTCGWALELRWR